VLAVGGVAVLIGPLLDLDEGPLDVWMEEHRVALNSVLVAGVAILARVIGRLAEGDEHRSQGSRCRLPFSQSTSAASAEQLGLKRDVRESPPAA
jgi:hypothetical protein